MTNDQRNQVFLVLQGPVVADPQAADVLATIAISDTYSLEPLIDGFIRDAEARGRFESLLELWAKMEERRTADLAARPPKEFSASGS